MNTIQHPGQLTHLNPEAGEWSGPINPVKAKALGKRLIRIGATLTALFFFGVCGYVMFTVLGNTLNDRTLYDISSLPACATEDSTDCYWNAAANGNGQGQDFINVDGETYYLAG